MRALSLLCALFSSTGLLLATTDPSWWTTGGVINRESSHEAIYNYSPANIGQLKAIATAAKYHLDAMLPVENPGDSNSTGAGSAINTLIGSWNPPTDEAERLANHAPLNIGQLKHVTEIFYNRLNAAGYDTNANLKALGYPSTWTEELPWPTPLPGASKKQNLGIANIGQVKLAFSFDVQRPGINVSAAASTIGADGTTAHPYPTIQAAVNAAQPGDTIKIASGIYREAITLGSNLDGSSKYAPLVFEGDGEVTICGSEPITNYPGSWEYHASGTDENGGYRIFKRAWSEIIPKSRALKHTDTNNPPNPPAAGIIYQHDSWTRYTDTVYAGGSESAPTGRVLRAVPDSTDLATNPWSVYASRVPSAGDYKTLYVCLPAAYKPEGFSGTGTEVHIEVSKPGYHPANTESQSGRPLLKSYRYFLTNPQPTDSLISNILVRNIRFLNGSTTLQQGMIEAGSGCSFENCVFEGASGLGLKVIGSGNSIINCKFLRNGEASMGGGGNGLRIENCEFGFNNWKGHCLIFEGSHKVFNGQNVVIRNCKSYFNCGPGIWFDWNCANIEVSNCEIFGNFGCHHPLDASGVFIEISPGPALVKNNEIYSNTGAAILIGESSRSNPDHESPPPDGKTLAFTKNSIADNLTSIFFRGIQEIPRPYRTGHVRFGSEGKGNTIYPQREWAIGNGLNRPWPTENATPPRSWTPSSDISITGNTYFDGPGADPSLTSHFFISWDEVVYYWARGSIDHVSLGIEPNPSVTSTPFQRRTMPSETAFEQISYPSRTFAEYIYPSHPINPTLAYTKKPYSYLLTPASVGQEVTIPVYARGTISTAVGGGYTCQIFDIYGNAIDLAFSDEATKHLVEFYSTVSVIHPALLKVKKSTATAVYVDPL